MKKPYTLLVVFLLFLASVPVMSACTPSTAGGHGELNMAPASMLPDFLDDAPPQVTEAYRFAAANPDVLQYFPCYCGCGAMGHQSNLDCYVKEIRPDGSVEMDNHAYGCSICVDITRDVMRMMAEGKDLKTMRAYVDAEYSQYGPATDTQPVP
jgi:hypothetical protein